MNSLFYHAIAKTSQAVSSKPSYLSLIAWNERVFHKLRNGLETDGGETGSDFFVMYCQENRIHLQGVARRRRGGGAKVYCNVNSMKRAYYFYLIPYVGPVCSHFPERCTHLLISLLV